MPQSPYRTTVYPPIQDVSEFRRGLQRHQASWERGVHGSWGGEGSLLNIGKALIEHCDFLEEKLDIKVRIYLPHI